MIPKMVCFLILLISLDYVVWAADPSTRVVLPQGILTGVRIQTERRVVVTAYLGIPYALPPLGPYRFAPPERHPGWNDSLTAEHFRPDCLQPRMEGNMRTTSEDCLYLNVFVPAAGSVSAFPVVVFIEGQDYVTGSPRIVEGQELAAEGVIVITLSYRLNVFGFLCLGDSNSRGNLGILDQYIALLWVRENVPYFGGRSDITLMGHGTGASSIVTHMASPRTQGLFSRAIIMSGSVFSPMLQPDSVKTASRSVIRSLGCWTEKNQASDSIAPLTCLRQKPAEEVLKAFENMHKNGNWTSQLVPLADSFLSDRMQYLPLSPQDAIQSGKFLNVPILTGTASNEGNVLLDRWNDLGSQNEDSVLYFINNTAIPNLMRARGLPVKQLASLLTWRYLDSLPGPRLTQLLHLYTDAAFLAPHWLQLKYLSKSSQPIFVYRFSQNKESDSGGFGSELPFIFGPLRKEQWQSRTGRNQASFAEERLSLRMKRLWTTFIRTGDPNPSSSNGSRLWPPFSSESEIILELFGDPISGRTMDLPSLNQDKPVAVFWNDLLPSVSLQLIQSQTAYPDIFIPDNADCGPYRSAMFTTLFFLVLLIVCLVLALVLLKKHLAGRQMTKL